MVHRGSQLKSCALSHVDVKAAKSQLPFSTSNTSIVPRNLRMQDVTEFEKYLLPLFHEPTDLLTIMWLIGNCMPSVAKVPLCMATS